jgi:hypothetical protein
VNMGKLEILSRVLAAVAGGYALASAATLLLAAVLPQARAEAVLTATLLSFVVYTAAVVWVFAQHRLGRVWVGLLGLSALLGGLGLLLARGQA